MERLQKVIHGPSGRRSDRKKGKDMMEPKDLMEAWQSCQTVIETMKGLDYESFMSIMCMLFDEYHSAHRDFDPVWNSRVVADLIEEVNKDLGEYVRRES